ncbi:MAG: TIR domain-containing protein [Promethearchaeota archaeon]
MKVFISYASTDLKPFRIPDMANRLENTEEIERVFYWDRDSTAQKSIVKYMEESITVSDVILILCTEVSNESGPVQQETDMAVYLNKRIVPIFQDINDVRISLRPKRGVKYFDDDFDSFFKELFMVVTEQLPEIPQEEEIMEFHGIPLVRNEYRAMKSLEEQLKILIPPIEPFCVKKEITGGHLYHLLVSIKKSGFGFVAENNHVIQFNFNRDAKQEELKAPIINFIPEAIGQLLYLRALNLSSQNISILPSFIGNLNKLEYFNVKNNKIQRFPETLTQLKNLKVFLFFNNLIAKKNYEYNIYNLNQSNYTILKSLLKNKCRIDSEFNAVIHINNPMINAIHKDVNCAYCGHGFNLEQKNLPLNRNKILCPISKHEKLCVFGLGE